MEDRLASYLQEYQFSVQSFFLFTCICLHLLFVLYAYTCSIYMYLSTWR